MSISKIIAGINRYERRRECHDPSDGNGMGTLPPLELLDFFIDSEGYPHGVVIEGGKLYFGHIFALTNPESDRISSTARFGQVKVMKTWDSFADVVNEMEKFEEPRKLNEDDYELYEWLLKAYHNDYIKCSNYSSNQNEIHLDTLISSDGKSVMIYNNGIQINHVDGNAPARLRKFKFFDKQDHFKSYLTNEDFATTRIFGVLSKIRDIMLGDVKK